MHEAAFELIEIPHVKLSGKNSADIRMVVDALDLCYTKEHIDTFVIISGDSDFSPLVSKLRENARTVIGVGVKQSTSDLLIANCDEFIFYDDLVASAAPESAKSASGKARKKSKKTKKKPVKRKADPAQEAIDLVIETTRALYTERGDKTKLWGSMIKQTLKRRSRDSMSPRTGSVRSATCWKRPPGGNSWTWKETRNRAGISYWASATISRRISKCATCSSRAPKLSSRSRQYRIPDQIGRNIELYKGAACSTFWTIKKRGSSGVSSRNRS